VYNLRAFVAEAIDSVRAQTLHAEQIEIVVVDDGSTDGSGDVVARYGEAVRLIRQPNRGLPAARNAGIRATTAPYVMFLDADDRIHPEKLDAQLEVFASRPDVSVVYTHTVFFDSCGARLPQGSSVWWEGDILPNLAVANLAPPHAMLFRRDAIRAAGEFDETLTSAEDWDLWIRITLARARWAGIPPSLTHYPLPPSPLPAPPGCARTARGCPISFAGGPLGRPPCEPFGSEPMSPSS